MQRLELRTTHRPVQNYYAASRQFDDLGITHETHFQRTIEQENQLKTWQRPKRKKKP